MELHSNGPCVVPGVGMKGGHPRGWEGIERVVEKSSADTVRLVLGSGHSRCSSRSNGDLPRRCE